MPPKKGIKKKAPKKPSRALLVAQNQYAQEVGSLPNKYKNDMEWIVEKVAKARKARRSVDVLTVGTINATNLSMTGPPPPSSEEEEEEQEGGGEGHGATAGGRIAELVGPTLSDLRSSSSSVGRKTHPQLGACAVVVP